MKTLILLCSIFLYEIAYTQTLAPNFTISDINGNACNLYQQCELGKTVVLNFYSVNCQACQEGVPTLENLWLTYGVGNSQIWVWGIESRGSSVEAIQNFMQTFGASYNMFQTTAQDSVLQLYGITSTPHYFVVCPDKKFKELSIENIENFLSVCFANDVEIVETSSCFIAQGTTNELVINSTISQKATIQLIDFMGTEAFRSCVFLYKGENAISFNKELRSSIYVLYIQTEKELKIKKIFLYRK